MTLWIWTLYLKLSNALWGGVLGRGAWWRKGHWLGNIGYAYGLGQVIITVIALLSIVWTRFCAQSFIKAFILERRPQQPCQTCRWCLHDIRNDELLGVKDRPGTCESLFFQEALGCKQQLPYVALTAYSMRSAVGNFWPWGSRDS